MTNQAFVRDFSRHHESYKYISEGTMVGFNYNHNRYGKVTEIKQEWLTIVSEGETFYIHQSVVWVD